MGTSCSSDRGKRELASLLLEIAKAKARLSALQAAIKEARSDAGLAAVHGVRAENEQILATNLLAERAARCLATFMGNSWARLG